MASLVPALPGHVELELERHTPVAAARLEVPTGAPRALERLDLTHEDAVHQAACAVGGLDDPGVEAVLAATGRHERVAGIEDHIFHGDAHEPIVSGELSRRHQLPHRTPTSVSAYRHERGTRPAYLACTSEGQRQVPGHRDSGASAPRYQVPGTPGSAARARSSGDRPRSARGCCRGRRRHPARRIPAPPTRAASNRSCSSTHRRPRRTSPSSCPDRRRGASRRCHPRCARGKRRSAGATRRSARQSPRGASFASE